MKLRNIKISTLLIIGFAIMLALVIGTGELSTIQNDELVQQTETMYNHPLKVRRAISSFKADVLLMQQSIKDMLLPESKNEITELDNNIQQTEKDVYEQLFYKAKLTINDLRKFPQLDSYSDEQLEVISDEIFKLAMWTQKKINKND